MIAGLLSSVCVGQAAELVEKAWLAESNVPDARFGQSVAARGDTNGDGFDDLLVGAPFPLDPDNRDRAQVHLFLGSPAGLEAVPSWSVAINDRDTQFGSTVAWAGDVNGDGFDDVLVGDPRPAHADRGRVFLYLGSATGPESAASWSYQSVNNGELLGTSVSGAGDVNGDGFDDVVVGAPEYSHGKPLEGRALVFHGSASGLEQTPAWTFESGMWSAHLGYSVDGAGDVNGDGFDDVVVGARYGHDADDVLTGRAYVFLGSAVGLATTFAWSDKGAASVDWFGANVAGVGDVNDDGFDDVVVGSHFGDQGLLSEGRAYLYLGSPSGPTARPAWHAGSGQEFGFLTSVAAGGDVDGDGLDDVLVGWSGFDDVADNGGRASLYRGTALGLAADPAWTATGRQDDSGLGVALSGGDLNGDGLSDVVAGFPGEGEPEAEEGRVRVYLAVQEAP